MMEVYRDINNARFIDSFQLWASVAQLSAENKGRHLMKNGGVKFYDNDYLYVKQPSVAITGVGGIPIRWTEHTPTDTVELSCLPGTLLSVPSLRQSMIDMMGFGGFYTYLNPRDQSPQSLQKIMTDKQHFSTAHAVYLNFIVLGISTAVENEFNGQRDIIHLSRLTEARTQSQSYPSVVVLFPEYLDTYKNILEYTQQTLAESRDISLNRADNLEVRNLVFPAAKATILGINASLRNLQKLVSGIQDKGKEEEYRRALAMINDNLAALLPEMFEISSNQGFNYPAHFKENTND